MVIDGFLHSAWHTMTPKLVAVIMMLFHEQTWVSSTFAPSPTSPAPISWFSWVGPLFNEQLIPREISGVSRSLPYNMAPQHFVPNISLTCHIHILALLRENCICHRGPMCVSQVIDFNENGASFCIFPQRLITVHIPDKLTHHTYT